jgi:hypothetical protein
MLNREEGRKEGMKLKVYSQLHLDLTTQVQDHPYVHNEAF